MPFPKGKHKSPETRAKMREAWRRRKLEGRDKASAATRAKLSAISRDRWKRAKQTGKGRPGPKPGAPQPHRRRSWPNPKPAADPRRRPAGTDALELDAIANGLTVSSKKHAQNPTFKVRTPDGRTIIETLIPDVV